MRYRALIFLFALPLCALAKDFGVRGHVFEIKEPSLVERISRELAEHDWKETNKEIAKKVKDRFHNLPNAGLSVAMEDKVVYEDFSFRLNKDIWAPQPDGSQVLLARKGMVINPFDYSVPHTRFFFFSAKDPNQVKIAENMYKKHFFRFVPVLVEGDLIKLVRDWGSSVYYAYPHVVKKLRVKKYPSLVGVKNKRLAIYEFSKNDLTEVKVENAWNSLD